MNVCVSERERERGEGDREGGGRDGGINLGETFMGKKHSPRGYRADNNHRR